LLGTGGLQVGKENTEGNSNKTKIYFDLSDELLQRLDDNQIAIADILAQAEVDAEIAYGIFPFQPEPGERTKDIRPIIVVTASAAGAALAISMAISDVLNTIYNRPHLVEISEVQVLRDQNGGIVFGEDHQPLYEPVKKYELIQPRPENQTQEFEMNWNPKSGILLKVKFADESVKE
jgi:hypothetical protein